MNTTTNTTIPASMPPPNPSASEQLPLEQRPQFVEVLERMQITKGNKAGEHKCSHCKFIKKAMMDSNPEPGWKMICGCSQEKGVTELLLIDRGILDVRNEDPSLRTLSKEEWFKLDHIMASLFGYNRSWLLDPMEMKAGLLAAYNKL